MRRNKARQSRVDDKNQQGAAQYEKDEGKYDAET